MPPRLTSLALAGGILAVSAAAIFVRFAQQDAGSLVIAAGRLSFATLALAPVALLRHRDTLRGLGARDLGLAFASGLLLAVHFASWIVSLEKTTVIDSVVLVTTTPLWVALASPLVLRERLPRLALAGLAIAFTGGLLFAFGGGSAVVTQGGAPVSTSDRWTGGVLALIGAWAMAGHLMVGRTIRARMRLVPYVFVVYGAAALFLSIAVLASGQPVTGLQPSTWGWILLLALVPQLIGHSTFNWALRHLPATPVALVLFGEPVGATLLALIVLGEVPAAFQIAGSLVILTGVFLAARAARAPAGAATPAG
jgi:drug/metabolite transporter (DMT)-like permease